ncbi:MAG TPA: hypothetical protein DEG96_07560, partial [Candidatus Atribacteria bacterium]|nr:hypothetical protein [Candidatus Atribacteria bacterium]
MKITIIGSGYVGLVTGTCLADFGLSVTCVDQDEQKINMLNSGGVPIYEPNLEALIQKNVSAGRLTFTTNLGKAVQQSKVIFIAVGTPPNHDGSANLKEIEEVALQIASSLNEYKVIVIKSTVPVGTTRKIKQIINKNQPESVIPAKPVLDPDRGAGIHLSSPSPLTGEHPQDLLPLRGGRIKVGVKHPFDIVSNPEFLREGSAV